MTINQTWAYNANDHDYKSSRDLIRGLVEVASRGGNFLLNVGPQPDGTIQKEFEERLAAIGTWVTINGDAIYGSTFGPIQGEQAFRTTSKGNKLFLHVFDWPSQPLTVGGINSKVLSARLLADNRPVAFHQTEAGVRLDLPPEAPDKDVSVVALKLV
jgi:alpha-L-fucosidase